MSRREALLRRAIRTDSIMTSDRGAAIRFLGEFSGMTPENTCRTGRYPIFNTYGYERIPSV